MKYFTLVREYRELLSEIINYYLYFYDIQPRLKQTLVPLTRSPEKSACESVRS